MLTRCIRSGCTTLVFGGGTCVEHEPVVLREYVRGRPFPTAGIVAVPDRDRRPERAALVGEIEVLERSGVADG